MLRGRICLKTNGDGAWPVQEVTVELTHKEWQRGFQQNGSAKGPRLQREWQVGQHGWSETVGKTDGEGWRGGKTTSTGTRRKSPQ